jgi:hypothetical protein
MGSPQSGNIRNARVKKGNPGYSIESKKVTL